MQPYRETFADFQARRAQEHAEQTAHNDAWLTRHREFLDAHQRGDVTGVEALVARERVLRGKIRR